MALDNIYRWHTLRISSGTIALLILLLTVNYGAEANPSPITQTNNTIPVQAQPTNTNQTFGEAHLIGQVNVHNLPEASGAAPGKNNVLPVHHKDEQQFAKEKAQANSPGFVPPGENEKVIATISTAPLVVSSNLILEGAPGDLPNPCSCSPPDPNVGAGPNHVFEMVNIAGIIYYKNGTIAKNTFALSSFFLLPTSSMTDPEILYDAGSGRWFASIVDMPNGRVQFAVSMSNDPTGIWNLYNVSTPFTSTLPDQPFIGASDDKFVISANDFIGNTFVGFQYWIFNKSELIAGTSTIHFSNNTPDTTFFSVHPAQHLGSSSGQFYMVSVGSGTTSTATLFTVGGVPPNPITITTNGFSINPMSNPPNAVQPFTGIRLATNDDRILSAVWESDTLWFSANDACIPGGDATTRSCARLIQITTAGTAPPTKVQDFDYASSGQYFFYPAVSLFQGQLVVVYGRSSSAIYPSLLVTGRIPSDIPNTLQTPFTIRNGSASDTSTVVKPARYGDYFGAATDPTPSANSTFWVAGEYRKSSGFQSWNTAIAQVATLSTPTPPGAPNITSFSPASPVSDTAGASRTFNITVNQTVNVTWYINGTQVQFNGSVINATYTNTSAAVGFWDVTAIAQNVNGTASQIWLWNVIAASAVTTNLTVFVRSTDNSVWYQNGNGTVWSGWQSLGGYVTSNISATSSGRNITIFAVGGNNAVWTRNWNGSAWSDWQSLGGYITSEISATSSGSNIAIFVRGGNNAVWTRNWNGSAWGDWQSLGGYITSNIASSSDAVNITIFALGGDNGLWTRNWNGSAWGDWQGLGGAITSDPDSVSSTSGTYVFVRGTDNAVWYQNGNGTVWSGWQSLGGYITSNIASSSDAVNITIFALGGDNGLWTRNWNGSAWGDWQGLGGAITSDPDSVSSTSGTYVFVRGTDNAVWYQNGNGTVWSGWQSLGGSTTGKPEVTSG